MRKYSYKGFYGDFGQLIEHNNGKTTLIMHVAGKTIKKSYTTLKGAKSALSRFSDCYTLTEIKRGGDFMNSGRYAPKKIKYFKTNSDIWIATGHVYKVTTDQGEIIHRSRNRLDYKETLKRFYKAGYTNVNIAYLGRDVSF